MPNLADQTIQFYIMILLTILSIVSQIWFPYILQRKKKELCYEVVVNDSLRNQLEGGLKKRGVNITLNLPRDLTVDDIQVTIIKFINTGNEPITRNDYERNINIYFDLQSYDQQSYIYLADTIINSTSPGLYPNYDYTGYGRVSLTPITLNSKDKISVVIFTVTGGRLIPPRVDWRIVGVSDIVDYYLGYERPKRQRTFTIGIILMIINLVSLVTLSVTALFPIYIACLESYLLLKGATFFLNRSAKLYALMLTTLISSLTTVYVIYNLCVNSTHDEIKIYIIYDNCVGTIYDGLYTSIWIFPIFFSFLLPVCMLIIMFYNHINKTSMFKVQEPI